MDNHTQGFKRKVLIKSRYSHVGFIWQEQIWQGRFSPRD
jgi:hypothetical protein